jgi:hypothetical protein
VRDKGRYASYGYWRNSDATAKAYADRWYSTGDIGRFDPVSKRLSIVDRKSNFVELYVDGRSVWVAARSVAGRPATPRCGRTPDLRSCHLSTCRARAVFALPTPTTP